VEIPTNVVRIARIEPRAGFKIIVQLINITLHLNSHSGFLRSMPDYQDIYNEVVNRDIRYNLAENSPGLRVTTKATDALSLLSGRSLDVGCGVGFVLDYLSGPSFDLMPYGVDASDLSIDKAKVRLKPYRGSEQRLFVSEAQKLPFENDFFSLVTCFDMLEHLDPPDISEAWKEIQRVLRIGGVFFGAVSCRKSGIMDRHGDNLHRTVWSVDQWLQFFEPDRAEYDAVRSQLMIWKHLRQVENLT
jgi:SAM-dependent methyltransferase